MDRIKFKDKEFRIFIRHEDIQKAVVEVAGKINTELKGKKPLLLGVLNGAFMFAADLMKNLDNGCEISFVKYSSYSGTASTGKINTLIGFNETIKGRVVVILEDIVDTGITLENLLKSISEFEPAEVKIATLLFKPNAYTKNIKLDYVGMEIPNDFIVGYGLDYEGLGRNLKDIYKIVDKV